MIHALATLAAWLEGLAVITALIIAHPAIATQRPRHTAVWLGRGTRLSLSPPEAFARLRHVLAQVA